MAFGLLKLGEITPRSLLTAIRVWWFGIQRGVVRPDGFGTSGFLEPVRNAGYRNGKSRSILQLFSGAAGDLSF